MQFRRMVNTDRSHIDALLARVRRCDGREGLSEQKLVDLRELGRGVGVVGEEAGAIVGYAHALVGAGASAWEVEFILDPDVRSRAAYGALSEAALTEIPGDGAAHLWATHPDHLAVLEAMGLEDFRELRQLRRRLPAPAPDRVAGVTVAAFRPGQDEQVWLAVFRQAFRDHPEGGHWPEDELHRRIALPWFDAGGFLLAWDGDELVAFCWTKVHDGAVGEIYIVGVHPGHQGRGLGRAMVLTGLEHLNEVRDCKVGMLYVDAGNPGAATLYEELGFHVGAISRCFLADR